MRTAPLDVEERKQQVTAFFEQPAADAGAATPLAPKPLHFRANPSMARSMSLDPRSLVANSRSLVRGRGPGTTADELGSAADLLADELTKTSGILRTAKENLADSRRSARLGELPLARRELARLLGKLRAQTLHLLLQSLLRCPSLHCDRRCGGGATAAGRAAGRAASESKTGAPAGWIDA